MLPLKEVKRMPKIEKATRRDRQRRKAINNQYQNVRYATHRAGEGLVRREVERTTRVKKEQ
jgi:hypothetical protein